jgi:NAD(P)-dependent dehydrogenase (short-subunit alcohol dehydrogenase family)
VLGLLGRASGDTDGLHVVTLDKEPGCTWQVDVAHDELPDGTFRVVQQCLRGMRERRYGRIVVISM